MWQNFIDSVNIVLPIFLLVVLGYILKRLKFASDKFYEDAEKFVFNVALPCQLFLSVAFPSGGVGEVDYIRLIIFCAIGVTLAFLLGVLVVPLIVKENGARGAIIQNTFRSNFAVLGMPLAYNIAGAAGQTTISILMPFIIIMFNAYSVIELNIFAPRESKKSIGQLAMSTLKSVVTNPLILSVMAGLPFLLTGWRPPAELSFFESTIGYLSETTQALILVSLGAGFSFSSLKSKIKYSLPTAIYKTVVLPLIAVTVAHLVFGFSGTELTVIFVLFGTPSAVSSYIMAKNLQSDGEVASQILLLSTMLCILTLFIGIFILKTLTLI